MKIVMTKTVAVAAAKKTVAGKSSIWGGIILLPSKKEVDWDGQSFEKGMEPLAAMKGTKYGTDWKWSGDLDPDECDIAVRMNGKAWDFAGPEAVKQLLDLAKKNGVIKAASKAVAGAALDAATKAKLLPLAKAEVKRVLGAQVFALLKSFSIEPMQAGTRNPNLQELVCKFDPKDKDAIGAKVADLINDDVNALMVGADEWYLGEGDGYDAISFGSDEGFADAPAGVLRVWLRKLNGTKGRIEKIRTAKASTTTAENTEEEDALEAAVLTELFKITPAFTQEEIESSHDNGRRISNARKLLLTKCYEKLLSPYPGLQERMDNIARLEAAQLMALGIMKPGKVSGVNMDIKEIRALYTKNKPLADRLAKKLADETYPGPAPRRAKATKAAEPGKLPKTLQLLKTLNASQFGAEWDKEADTVRVWATGTQRPMQFRIIGQLDKSIKEDTGAKSVMVMPGTSYKPNSLALNGKLNSKPA